jgi:hypothetical protein
MSVNIALSLLQLLCMAVALAFSLIRQFELAQPYIAACLVIGAISAVHRGRDTK